MRNMPLLIVQRSRKMDEFWRLVLLAVAMFIGCYLAGSIPLVLSLSEVSGLFENVYLGSIRL